MIVLGADTHKSSRTIAAVDIATGQLVADKTVAVGARGFAALLMWARALGPERLWAWKTAGTCPARLSGF